MSSIYSTESRADGYTSFPDWTSNARNSVRGTLLLACDSVRQTHSAGSGHLLSLLLVDAFGEKAKQEVIILLREYGRNPLPSGKTFPLK